MGVLDVHVRACAPFLRLCIPSTGPCASPDPCHLCSLSQRQCWCPQSCIYSVAAILWLRVLLKRGWSRKSRKGSGGAPSSSSTVMLLGQPTCSTEPGTKRVCWGPRWGQYRPRLQPFIHSWPWKMETGLICALVHPHPSPGYVLPYLAPTRELHKGVPGDARGLKGPSVEGWPCSSPAA